LFHGAVDSFPAGGWLLILLSVWGAGPSLIPPPRVDPISLRFQVTSHSSVGYRNLLTIIAKSCQRSLNYSLEESRQCPLTPDNEFARELHTKNIWPLLINLPEDWHLAVTSDTCKRVFLKLRGRTQNTNFQAKKQLIALKTMHWWFTS
jgi:hypothetical protein